MTIKETLKKVGQKLRGASFVDQPELEAEILLGFVMGKPREWLLANLDQPLGKDLEKELAKLIDRRLTGEPIAYLIGKKEFYGLEFVVNRDVLIPRPETELLVKEALKFLGNKKSARVIDIGTGSGAIAISIGKNQPRIEVWASDISLKALRVARENGQKHQVNIKFIESDLFSNISGRFDLIIANLPYLTPKEITTTTTPLSDPIISLDGGVSGLEIVKRLLLESKGHLKKEGEVIIEIAPEQKNQLIEFIRKYCFQATIKVKRDLSGRDRVLVVKLSSP